MTCTLHALRAPNIMIHQTLLCRTFASTYSKHARPNSIRNPKIVWVAVGWSWYANDIPHTLTVYTHTVRGSLTPSTLTSHSPTLTLSQPSLPWHPHRLSSHPYGTSSQIRASVPPAWRPRGHFWAVAKASSDATFTQALHTRTPTQRRGRSMDRNRG